MARSYPDVHVRMLSSTIDTCKANSLSKGQLTVNGISLLLMFKEAGYKQKSAKTLGNLMRVESLEGVSCNVTVLTSDLQHCRCHCIFPSQQSAADFSAIAGIAGAAQNQVNNVAHDSKEQSKSKAKLDEVNIGTSPKSLCPFTSSEDLIPDLDQGVEVRFQDGVAVLHCGKKSTAEQSESAVGHGQSKAIELTVELGRPALPRASEEQWQKRIQKRYAALAMVKDSAEYQDCPLTCRPRTPSPDDRSVSKRHWEEKMARWRCALRTSCPNQAKVHPKENSL
mmetsp:Transcript_92725/g.177994  ORF Transcript_92725/g.177994 Transcript_92725/m.177994 type:complete len:281 (+) Transcript_92725:90-932(+)